MGEIKMLYTDYLKKKHPCPFCKLNPNEIIKQNKKAYLVIAKAPYTKYHLLVVPKKHKIKLNDLTPSERDSIEKLIYFGLKKLKKKYKSVSILYREGSLKHSGKSIKHLHYHLIPKLRIGSIDINLNNRKIFNGKDYEKEIRELKKFLK
jgi:diadenosine tetraphosphate (Ap4A) HIT family hydrolase